MEENNLSEFKIVAISCTKDSRADKNKYRIMSILKVEKEIIANIAASPIFLMMSVEVFRTDVIVFIGDVIMCFTLDWPINVRMRVTN